MTGCCLLGGDTGVGEAPVPSLVGQASGLTAGPLLEAQLTPMLLVHVLKGAELVARVSRLLCAI